MLRFKIPEEVSTELKLTKFIYLTDLMVILILFLIRFMTVKYVHSALHWPFTIFLVLVGIIVIIRPLSNPQKRMYEALMFTVLRRKDSYCAIPYDEKEILQWRKTKTKK